jgi:hypothetical protein
LISVTRSIVDFTSILLLTHHKNLESPHFGS